jgi:uncharacterized protein YdaT
MPWTPEEFKRKHAKKLPAAKAGKAAAIANAILARGGDEGTAIATGIARAKGMNHSKHGLEPK